MLLLLSSDIKFERVYVGKVEKILDRESSVSKGSIEPEEERHRRSNQSQFRYTQDSVLHQESLGCESLLHEFKFQSLPFCASVA